MDKFFGFEFPGKLALRNYPQLPRREGYLVASGSSYGPELAILLENILFRVHVGTLELFGRVKTRGSRASIANAAQIARQKSIDNPTR